jgi:hypothetical protein
VRCFVLVRKLEEKGLQAREANGRNDERTNANELGFVFRSCSYANVGFFLGTKSDADDANTLTDRRTRPLARASGRASQEWGSRDPEEPTPTRESQP